MKTYKLNSLVRVINASSDHYLNYGELKSIPESDINGYVKVMIDSSNYKEAANYSLERWFNPNDLKVINSPL